VSAPDAAEIERIETALREWRQGDATLDDGAFIVHLADKRAPLTAAARDSVEGVPGEFNLYDVFTAVKGLVVVSQSCDIVKKCADCEYVEVSPLVEINNPAQMRAIRKGAQLRYAYLPGLADRNFAVDLGRTMTVEKAVVALAGIGSLGVRRIKSVLTSPKLSLGNDNGLRFLTASTPG
jgi:hypothetical protein